MTIIFETSDAELVRMHNAGRQGLKARMCLAQNTGSLTRNSTTAQWDAAEITAQAADGYARVEWTVPAATMTPALGMAQSVIQVVTFQASAGGLGLEFDSAYLVLGTISGGTTTWLPHITDLFRFSPSKALTAGQPWPLEFFMVAGAVTAIPNPT
jgi:hypothetical protein